MPYRLRRVIAVNIVAAKTGQPSSLIAELDVRGKTMAVGINGVGKTTFLRTIPLFYGALPKEILKGTHRGSMIAYTLPTSSSAIVYEYERTSEEDLRCAVMYRRPNEDEAVFYIMRSGYEERFFVDENEEFMDAPSFKARAEAAGIWVSQALRLNQYRSIILREKPMTKNGAKLREMALEHSLGPRTLYNLGPIAAAISTEKINFDDLKRIVVDRVSEDSGQAGGSGILAQKPIREEVKRWLETREHMAAILARKMEAEKLMQRVTSLRSRHMELCSLHVAVKATIERCQRHQQELTQVLQSLQESARASEQELNAQLARTQEELAKLRSTQTDLDDEIDRIEKQKAHFNRIGIEALQELALRKPVLLKQLDIVNRQLDDMGDTARNAQERAEHQIRTVEKAGNQALMDLVQSQAKARETNKDALERIRIEETNARSQLQAPIELQELNLSLQELLRTKGGLENQLKSPQAKQETLEASEEAEDELERSDKNVRDKEASARSAQKAQADAQHTAKQTSQALEQLKATIDRAHDRLQELQAQLTPEEGSLLAFLRKHDEAGWADAARVLAPELTRRTDLAPDILDDASATGGRVTIGPLSLDIHALPVPGWVHEPEIQQEIATQQASLQEMRNKLTEVQDAANKKAKALKDADGDLSATLAQLELARKTREKAGARRETLRNQIKKERQASTQTTREALHEQQAKIEATEERISELTQAMATRKNELQKEFDDRRTAIEDTLRHVLDMARQTENELRQQMSNEKASIQNALDRELQGQGIDASRMQQLKEQCQQLEDKLRRISAAQGDLHAWAEFSSQRLPTLPSKIRERDAKCRQIQELGVHRSQLENQLHALHEEIRRRSDALIHQRQDAESGARLLSELREGSLANFMDYVAAPQEEFQPEDLRRQVNETLSRLSTESTEMQTQCRSLRNELLRYDNQVADWLRLKEKDLPDPQILLSHQYEWNKAEIVCQWFEPAEHGQLLAQLNKEKISIFMAAGGFVDALKAFDRNVGAFNRNLKKALTQIPTFHSIGELDVNISSGVGKLAYLRILESIRDRHRALSGTVVSLIADDRELPSEDDTRLMRDYRGILQADGGYSINLREQVELECSLRENSKRHVVRNSSEFAAISSTGLTALITSLFLMGFVQMIRDGEAVPAITWPSDEIARLDAQNVASFLKTLDECGIHVVCAAPNADPTLARHFDRISSFEADGSVATAQLPGATT